MACSTGFSHQKMVMFPSDVKLTESTSENNATYFWRTERTGQLMGGRLGFWWYKSNPFPFSETFSLQMVSALCFLRGPLECRRRRKMYTLGIILTWGRLLLQNVAWMVAKKLLVDDKIKACVKQVFWVLYGKFRIPTRQVKHFAFLKNVCYQYLYFLLWVTQILFSYDLLIGHNQLSGNVLLLSCNPIGQLCLGGSRLQ